MERVGRAHALALDALRVEARLQRLERRVAARDDRERGRVDRGRPQAVAEVPPELRLRKRHRQHRAGGHRRHQAPAQRHEPQRVLEREHAGEARGHELADAVADRGVGHDAPRHPQAREGVLDDEERRLRVARVGQALVRRVGGAVLRMDDRAQVTADLRLEDGGALVDDLAEERHLAIEVGAHPGVLRTLAREQEDDRPVLPVRLPRRRGVRILEGADGGRAVGRDHGAAVTERAAADLEREGHVGEVRTRIRGEVRREVRGGALEAAGRVGRHDQQLVGPRRVGVLPLGRLFDDEVRVGATEPERADAGTTGPAVGWGRPLCERRVHVERRLIELQVGVEPLEARARRQLPPLHRQHGLDEAGDARRRVEVPDVRLDGAERAAAAAEPLAERLHEPLDLDRVAERRGGAVRLDVLDVGRVDGRRGERVGDDLALPADGRRGETGLPRAVVVDRRSGNHRADRVAVGEGVLEPLEHHHAHAVAEHRAVGGRVERPAAPVGRHDAVFLVPVARRLGHVHRRRAGDRDVALAVEEALRGQVDRDERGRARRLQGVARAAQVQLEGDARRQVLQLVADGDGQDVGAAEQVVVPVQMVDVRGRRRASVEPDRPLVRAGVVAGLLERLPGGLEEEALVGVHQGRIARAEPEERRVEVLDALEHPAGLHVRRVRERLRAHAGRRQLLVGEMRDRLRAVADDAPVRVEVGRAGKAADHRDDRDSRGRRAVFDVVCHACYFLVATRRRCWSRSRCARSRLRWS